MKVLASLLASSVVVAIVLANSSPKSDSSGWQPPPNNSWPGGNPPGNGYPPGNGNPPGNGYPPGNGNPPGNGYPPGNGPGHGCQNDRCEVKHCVKQALVEIKAADGRVIVFIKIINGIQAAVRALKYLCKFLFAAGQILGVQILRAATAAVGTAFDTLRTGIIVQIGCTQRELDEGRIYGIVASEDSCDLVTIPFQCGRTCCSWYPVKKGMKVSSCPGSTG